MNPVIKNFFADMTAASGAEQFLTLLETKHVRVERIVSNGQGSPPGFWYDQPEEEWVLLVQGTATLQFADESISVLNAGDYLSISRHLRHRVEETSGDAIWLAVHCG